MNTMIIILALLYVAIWALLTSGSQRQGSAMEMELGKIRLFILSILE